VQLPDPPSGATTSVAGSTRGLYGGTNLIDVCDREVLVDFLTSDRAKGDAWASVHGITRDQIPAFVAGLTDVILQVDTRVTNHGYRDGEPVAIDSVLQAGTAVLIDNYGIPRVRCYCGNPLLEARTLSSTRATVTGTTWRGFELDKAVIVSPVDAITELVLDDLTSDALLTRAPGADASQAQPIQQTTTLADDTTTTTTRTTLAAERSTVTAPATGRATTTTTTTTEPRATTTSTTATTVSSTSTSEPTIRTTTTAAPTTDTTVPTTAPTTEPNLRTTIGQAPAG
jgi:hypothetical protein